ncbi:MerR family transcriptional regulator [Massilia atriviolacea]|uniref:MerR family transcriptional regulator n=1 Tax=Massilia atriviolacea TaxID=2495579 RepID=A0A430HCJ1_9BURK|nr:MerR family transcriptional regulator [Massilia atriviolacea]RSZ55224.1 MerR family transcriptional regulator [Massilia atriviolacea]
MLLKIGQLARRSGLSVRALRHYDDIALLTPSVRSDKGYRLYDSADVARLYRIQALRRLDLPLTDIQAMLADGGASLPHVVAQQIASLERQIAQATALHGQLRDLQAQLDQHHEPSMDNWLAALERMAAGARYFTDAELQTLKTRRGQSSANAELTATLHALMAGGAAPDSPQAGALARRWIATLLEDAGGDEGMLMKLYAMNWNEPTLHTLSGVDRAAMQFISHAMAHRRLAIYANYCSPAEMALLRRHYVAQTDAWPALICALRNHLNDGTSATSPEVQALARQWQALSLAKAAGDAALQARLRHAFEQESELRTGSGIDAPLLAYVQGAMQAL